MRPSEDDAQLLDPGEFVYACIAKGTYIVAEYEVPRSSDSSSPDPSGLDSMYEGADSQGPRHNRYSASSSSSSTSSSFLDIAVAARRVLASRGAHTLGRRSYIYGNLAFNSMSGEDGIVWMCVNSISLGTDIPFSFLTRLHHRTHQITSNPQGQSAGVLSQLLKALLDEANGVVPPLHDTFEIGDTAFNLEGDDDADGLMNPTKKMLKVEKQLKNVADAARDNINRVLQRSEHIDSLMSKASTLSHQSAVFRTSSRQLHRKLWWQGMRRTFCLSVTFILLCLIVTSLTVCGVPWRSDSSCGLFWGGRDQDTKKPDSTRR